MPEALIVPLVTPLLEESDIRELRSCLEKLRATPEEELQVLSAYIRSLDFARYGLKTIPREAVLQDKIP